MKTLSAFGIAFVLSSVLAVPGFAAVGSEQARDANAHNQEGTTHQTTTTQSPPTMSTADTPSRDSNNQVGNNQRTSNPAANAGCGGAC